MPRADNTNFKRTSELSYLKEKVKIFCLTRIFEIDTYFFFQVSSLFLFLEVTNHTLRIQFLNLFLVNTRMGKVKVH